MQAATELTEMLGLKLHCYLPWLSRHKPQPVTNTGPRGTQCGLQRLQPLGRMIMAARCRITVFALVPPHGNQNKMFFHCSQKNTSFQIFRKTQSSHKCYLQFGAPYMLLQASQLNYSSWFEKDWVTYRSFPVPGQECSDLQL